MSEQDEKLQAARRLVNEKRYDEARALLRTIPDNPTAQRWLQKLEGTASQSDRRTSSVGNLLMLAAILVILVVTFAVGVYGAFLKPVPTAMARSDIEDIIGPEIETITSTLGGIERTIDARLTLISTEVRSQLGRIDTSVSTETQMWEYKTLVAHERGYGPFGWINDTVDNVTDSGSYKVDRVYFLEDKQAPLIQRLNELGSQGWELVGFVHNPGDIETVFIFKRPAQ